MGEVEELGANSAVLGRIRQGKWGDAGDVGLNLAGSNVTGKGRSSRGAKERGEIGRRKVGGRGIQVTGGVRSRFSDAGPFSY